MEYSTELIPAWYKVKSVGCAECAGSETVGFVRTRYAGRLSSLPCVCLQEHEKSKTVGMLVGGTIFSEKMWTEATKENCQKNIKNFDSMFSDSIKELLKKRKSIYLFGSMNTGKTLLSMYIARKFLETGVPTMLYPVGEILREFKAFNASYKEFFDRVMNIDVLILDDLGSQVGTDFNDSSLFDVINGRYMRGKQTIITGNLGLSEVKGKTSPIMERIFSKIERDYEQIGFSR